MNEPQTLTEDDVAGIETGTPDTRTPDPYLDGVADYLKGGSLTAAEIVRRVFQNPEPDEGAVEALERQMAADPRFQAMADGWDLVGLPAAEGKSIGECLAANEAAADRLADPGPCAHCSAPKVKGWHLVCAACWLVVPEALQAELVQSAATDANAPSHAEVCNRVLAFLAQPTGTPVAPVEGTGSETIASETPAETMVHAASIMDAATETIAKESPHGT